MDPEHDNDELRRALSALPRDGGAAAGEEDRLVARLRHDGFLRPTGWRVWAPRLATAAALLLIGGLLGAYITLRLVDARTPAAEPYKTAGVLWF